MGLSSQNKYIPNGLKCSILCPVGKLQYMCFLHVWEKGGVNGPETSDGTQEEQSRISLKVQCWWRSRGTDILLNLTREREETPRPSKFRDRKRINSVQMKLRPKRNFTKQRVGFVIYGDYNYISRFLLTFFLKTITTVKIKQRIRSLLWTRRDWIQDREGWRS